MSHAHQHEDHAATTMPAIAITSTGQAAGITTTATTATSTTIDGGVHLPLLVWLSPAFPVGAFAYSHGLEWAHEAGDVTDAASLEDWLGDLLAFGAARNDAILFAATYRAARRRRRRRLAEVAELALALATSPGAPARDDDAGRRLRRRDPRSLALRRRSSSCRRPGPSRSPIRSRSRSRRRATTSRSSRRCEAFVLGFVSNLVSAAVRLGIVGQTDGQRVIAALVPAGRGGSPLRPEASLDDLGGAAFRSDLAALRHETQYTRLFRS